MKKHYPGCKGDGLLCACPGSAPKLDFGWKSTCLSWCHLVKAQGLHHPLKYRMQKYSEQRSILESALGDAEGFQVAAEELVLSVKGLMDFEGVPHQFLWIPGHTWSGDPVGTPKEHVVQFELATANFASLDQAQDLLLKRALLKVNAQFIADCQAVESSGGVEVIRASSRLLSHPDLLLPATDFVTEPDLRNCGYVGIRLNGPPTNSSSVVHTSQREKTPANWSPYEVFAFPDPTEAGLYFIDFEVETDHPTRTVSVTIKTWTDLKSVKRIDLRKIDVEQLECYPVVGETQ